MICMFNAIHYCLQMCLKILEINLLKYMDLILAIFYLDQDYMASLLKKAAVKLELLIDIDMLLMVEEETSGGLVMQYIGMVWQTINI